MHEWFQKFARQCSAALGSSPAFIITIAVIFLWSCGGFIWGFTDTYQLVINTVSTLTTSIYVVLVQNTQNHDTTALNLKLDEVIRALALARNSLIALEHCTDAELDQLQQEFQRLRQARTPPPEGTTGPVGAS